MEYIYVDDWRLFREGLTMWIQPLNCRSKGCLQVQTRWRPSRHPLIASLLQCLDMEINIRPLYIWTCSLSSQIALTHKRIRRCNFKRVWMKDKHLKLIVQMCSNILVDIEGGEAWRPQQETAVASWRTASSDQLSCMFYTSSVGFQFTSAAFAAHLNNGQRLYELSLKFPNSLNPQPKLCWEPIAGSLVWRLKLHRSKVDKKNEPFTRWWGLIHEKLGYNNQLLFMSTTGFLISCHFSMSNIPTMGRIKDTS